MWNSVSKRFWPCHENGPIWTIPKCCTATYVWAGFPLIRISLIPKTDWRANLELTERLRNRIDEPVLMAGHKSLLTESGIHYRLDLCSIHKRLFCLVIRWDPSGGPWQQHFCPRRFCRTGDERRPQIWLEKRWMVTGKDNGHCWTPISMQSSFFWILGKNKQSISLEGQNNCSSETLQSLLWNQGPGQHRQENRQLWL